MIRFRRLFDIVTERDRRQADEIRAMFGAAFPIERRAADRYLAYIEGRRADFETIILIAENERGDVLGFSMSMYFPELRYGYLVYIASDPQRAARGIGGALYEALREHLMRKGARGLFLDAGPIEARKLKDPALLAVNKRRMQFYERYGARPIEGTLYDEIGNPKNEDFKVTLLFDPLGRGAPLKRADARLFLTRMFKAQYGQSADDAYVRAILASFKEDPVRLCRSAARPAPSTPAARRMGWLKPLKLVVCERHEIHHLREKGYVERPVRMAAVLKGLEAVPLERVSPRRFPDGLLSEVHDPELVGYLKAISEKLDPKTILYPEVFPIRRPERRPRELESRAGYFCIDTFTPVTHNVWRAARAAADAAMTAADLVLDGARFAYALLRPPGHHAERRVYGGFCYLNNAALAANRLSKFGKVAVIDVDYHHGNGTQNIFYQRSDVFTLSIHGTPNFAYPHFAGFEDERGEGEGRGFNRNFPLRRGVDDVRYLEVLDEALRLIRRFKPTWLVVSLGYDLMSGDPTGSFVVTARGMREIGARLGGLGPPSVIVQEGGYALPNLRRGAAAFFDGLGATWY